MQCSKRFYYAVGSFLYVKLLSNPNTTLSPFFRKHARFRKHERLTAKVTTDLRQLLENRRQVKLIYAPYIALGRMWT